MGGGGKGAAAYLVLVEDSIEAVEELERGDDVALYEDAGDDCCSGPEACADGHFPKPRFEGESGLSAESSLPATHHLVHRRAVSTDSVAISRVRLQIMMLRVLLVQQGIWRNK